MTVPTEAEKFAVLSPTFSQQYSSIYYSRFSLINFNNVNTVDIVTLVPNKKATIKGTIYKHDSTKPALVHTQAPEHTYAIEDTTGRILLQPNSSAIQEEEHNDNPITVSSLVTGVTVALTGFQSDEGLFVVEKIHYPTHDPQRPLPNPKYKVAILSGLSLPSTSAKLTLLYDYLCGHLAKHSIEHLIIAGNSTQKPKSVLQSGKKFGKEVHAIDLAPLEVLDTFINGISRVMRVDLMSGFNDYTAKMWPQAKIQKGLFKGKNFNSVGNPHYTDVQGVSILGTSGQNVDDIIKYSDVKSRLEVAKQTIQWLHIAPTAPDTLSCYPFKDDDPFVLTERPHLYFIGNQPKFETTMLKGTDNSKTRIVLVPSFEETGEIAIVDFETLDCHSFKINVDELQEETLGVASGGVQESDPMAV